MRFGIEVRRSEDLDHARQRLAALEEDGAEHGALGIEVVRRDAGRQLQRAHRTAASLRSMHADRFASRHHSSRENRWRACIFVDNTVDNL